MGGGGGGLGEFANAAWGGLVFKHSLPKHSSGGGAGVACKHSLS